MSLNEEQRSEQETAAANAAGEKRWRESQLERLAQIEADMNRSTHPLADVRHDVHQ